MVLKHVMKTFSVSIDLHQHIESNTTHVNNMDARMSLLRKHTLSSRASNSQNSLEFELSRFSNIKEPQPDVLDFWRTEEVNFPMMAAIAKVLLSKPATSAASESAFSVAGSLISSKRASLEPLRARKILFIHDNYDLLHNEI